jgi:hypothetical protein
MAMQVRPPAPDPVVSLEVACVSLDRLRDRARVASGQNSARSPSRSPRLNAACSLRTTSTFSCDIARPVSAAQVSRSRRRASGSLEAPECEGADVTLAPPGALTPEPIIIALRVTYRDRARDEPCSRQRRAARPGYSCRACASLGPGRGRGAGRRGWLLEHGYEYHRLWDCDVPTDISKSRCPTKVPRWCANATRTVGIRRRFQGFLSAPSRIRTCGLLLRRESLYPAELSGLEGRR